jgi:hypothetical protein
MPTRISTYAEAFDMLNIRSNDRIKGTLARLEKEGRSEKSICFALWKSQERIMQFRGDTRFYSVFENEVRKWSWGKDDPRWIEHNKKKAEQEKAEELKKEAEKLRREVEKQQKLRMEYKKKYPGFIYFIQGSTGGAVKIGYAKDVSIRLKSLQTGYPDTLIILCAVPGSPMNEKFLHNKFSNHKLQGEWFKPVSEILEFAEKYKIKIPSQEQYKTILEKSQRSEVAI